MRIIMNDKYITISSLTKYIKYKIDNINTFYEFLDSGDCISIIFDLIFTEELAKRYVTLPLRDNIQVAAGVLMHKKMKNDPLILNFVSHMYPLCWTKSSKEGFYMKYDFVFKLNSVELYRNGRWPDTPEGINQKNFRKRVKTWAKLADLHGIDALRHPTTCTKYTAEERYNLVARVLAGESQKSVAISAGINDSQLSKWVKQYKIYGYDGLNLKKGRRSKESTMKKTVKPSELSISEREELIRLRAETEYLRTENEVIKKLIALRREKEVAQLKAKKQQSSKNSEKKDTN